MRAIATLTVLLFSACATTLESERPAPVPDLRVGESWTYRELNDYNGQPLGSFRYEIMQTRPSPAGKLFRDGEPYAQPQGLQQGVYSATHYAYLPAFMPPYAAYSFPLNSGKSWTYQTAPSAVVGNVPLTVCAKVRGWEKVTVPAGEFDALKIVRYIYVNDVMWWRSPTRITEVDWYAPQVDAVVKRVHDSEYYDYRKTRDMLVKGDRIRWELLSHSPGQKLSSR
jgi:hypothetical protein